MASTPIEYTPAFNVTVKANEALAAGTLVAISGEAVDRCPVVAKAAAGKPVFGVVAQDAAKDAFVTVYRAGVYEILAENGVTAGDAVEVAAGKAKKSAGTNPVIGIAVSKTAAGRALVALK
ncbi:MAG: DUF2190 family protein [Corynebacterium sp.]|nr:DUF2190 family protein [Corynebacterium sp.]